MSPLARVTRWLSSPRANAAAAAGITGVARTIGAAIAPVIAGLLLGRQNLASALFFTAGGLKIVYDLLLYRGFLSLRPVEEGLSRGNPTPRTSENSDIVCTPSSLR